MFEKVLVANRGEIAIRVMRTLREMGIASVGVYSEADRETPARPLRRRGVPARPGRRRRRATSTSRRSSRSPKESGAEAIHPGYGFLAENADFATRLRRGGHRLHRPAARARSRRWARRPRRASSCRRPACRSSRARPSRPRTSTRRAKAAKEIGYPVACKAAGGGGGKGFRVALTAGRPRGGLRGRRPRGREVLLRRPRLPRALPRGPAPRRGPGARRLARQRDPPRRARLLDPAPPPEADRGGARRRTSTRRCASGSARSPPTPPRRSTTAAPARSRACRSATSTSSSR